MAQAGTYPTQRSPGFRLHDTVSGRFTTALATVSSIRRTLLILSTMVPTSAFEFSASWAAWCQRLSMEMKMTSGTGRTVLRDLHKREGPLAVWICSSARARRNPISQQKPTRYRDSIQRDVRARIDLAAVVLPPYREFLTRRQNPTFCMVERFRVGTHLAFFTRDPTRNAVCLVVHGDKILRQLRVVVYRDPGRESAMSEHAGFSAPYWTSPVASSVRARFGQGRTP